jgi:hypothetical protein
VLATSTTSLDPFGIPFFTSVRRRASSVALIAWTVRRAGVSAAQLREAAARASGHAAADPRLRTVVPALWRLEAMAASAGRHHLDAAPLITHQVPPSAQPIAHVGWATGVAQRLGFHADALKRELAPTTHESYRGFCWDGIGADLLVYSRPSVRIIARLTGIIGGGATPPDREGHFARLRSGLSSEEDRLIAHGLGRMEMVTQKDLRSALREAGRLPAEWGAPAVQGIAFAFAMMNHADLPLILERSRDIAPAVAAPFHDGLVYAVVFAEWLGRGLLASWQPRGAFERELVERARCDAALNVRRGHPLAFALSDRVTTVD